MYQACYEILITEVSMARAEARPGGSARTCGGFG
jgi:hypothetical protein